MAGLLVFELILVGLGVFWLVDLDAELRSCSWVKREQAFQGVVH